jgi:hypothetical protein
MVWFWLGALARGEIVDAVLHVVGDRIVTQSDVTFEADFDPHDRSPLIALEDPDYPLETRLVDFAILRELAGDIEIYRRIVDNNEVIGTVYVRGEYTLVNRAHDYMTIAAASWSPNSRASTSASYTRFAFTSPTSTNRLLHTSLQSTR